MISTALFSWLGSDQNLMHLMAQNWIWGIALVATVIFCETGLVVLPFLPGDSLLFATGTFLGISSISPLVSIVSITLAAVAGDGVNFAIGRSRVGKYLLRSAWIKPHHLIHTQAYFDRFGGPTITIGRFVPVVRTIAPFMAGLSGMCPRRFAIFNVMGALVWCCGLITAGYWLGQIPWVKGHMTWITTGIVALSMIPVGAHFLQRLMKGQD